MRNVASLYQVYHLSGSSVQLGLAGFFQAFPFIIFGLFGGVLADTLNRKKLIAITHTLNILPGVALGILTLSGAIQVWHVNVLNLVASSLQVLGGPSRQAIIPGLVPQSHLLNAVTMAVLMMQGTQLTAPVIAGFLIDFLGVQASYFTDAGLLLPSVIAALLIRASGQPQGRTPANKLAQSYRRLRISLAHSDYFVFVSPRFFCRLVWFFPSDITDFRGCRV